MHEVVLINMPFGPIFQPALGLSILREIVAQRGRSVRIEYLSLDFASPFGFSYYEKISEFYPSDKSLIGEWLFSHALFPNRLTYNDAARLISLDQYSTSPHFEELLEFVDHISSSNAVIERFLADNAERIVNSAPRIVGFSSMFQQHLASLALAKAIKSLNPDIVIVFGGSNCEGVMGYETARSFPFVDVVVSGAGEVVFPDIVDDVLQNRPIRAGSGVTLQVNIGAGFGGENAPEMPMDDLPFVRFDDFFEAFFDNGTAVATNVIPSVLLETSRGCWWGQKQHCTFCGLNGAEMHFRAKSPSKAVSEFNFLSTLYPKSRIVVTDNIIPNSYYEYVLPLLRKEDFPNGIFYEIKSNVNETQIRRLAEAGVDMVQVGVESLSTNVLTLMRKGTSMLQNIECLKLCTEYHIIANWLLLMGFPGEKDEDYEAMITLLPRIHHLRPPEICTDIRIDRFSPNFNQAAAMGFRDVRPVGAYGEIYRDVMINVYELAYYFAADAEDGEALASRRRELCTAVKVWQDQAERAEFWVFEAGDEDVLVDLRVTSGKPGLLVLDAMNSRILRGCGSRVGVARCLRDADVVQNEQEARLNALSEIGAVVCERSAILGLPLRVGKGRHRPSEALWRALREEGLLAPQGDGSEDLVLEVGTTPYVGIKAVGGYDG